MKAPLEIVVRQVAPLEVLGHRSVAQPCDGYDNQWMIDRLRKFNSTSTIVGFTDSNTRPTMRKTK